MYEAEIICDSINQLGIRATTIAITFPRIILAELNTHRMFSRSTTSSRAIPIMTTIKQVWNNPFIPIYFGKNKTGMQSSEEITGMPRILAETIWIIASKIACIFAFSMYKLGLHKQLGNRLLETWVWATTLITATEWDNFFMLRKHEDAQPEFQKLANIMNDAIESSIPIFLKIGEWHMPYVSIYEQVTLPIAMQLKISTARCARVSYYTHGTNSLNVEKDLKLHDLLIESTPKHASPTEHQLTPQHELKYFYNVNSWKSYRYYLDNDVTQERL